MLQTFGIRHHGPGSALRLQHALRSYDPDCVLVEGPSDANDLLHFINHGEMEPPVALIVYNPKNFSQAAYYPFARFSPEWQAIRYALEKRIEVAFIDLPQGFHFTLDQQNQDQKQLQLEIEQQGNRLKIDGEELAILQDPLAYLAKIAGYTDSERWWEVHFEQCSDEMLFPLIIELISELRQTADEWMPARERQREAYMREQIRKAVKAGHQKIAVVCGAWHSPVLQAFTQYKTTADKALLKGVKATKTQASWVPWTYERLARQSGYGAGVISPAYYEQIYDHSKELGLYWMSRVSRLLREEDQPASVAHSIEAVRLAETLAIMRSIPLPGLDEMKEAATAIFGGGDIAQLNLIEQKLIIGDVMGRVPEEMPVVPIQQDLDKLIKSARLTKERNAPGVVDKELDLRKSTNQNASFLLRRLIVLGIDWGWEQKVRKYGLHGDFHEHWKLKWKPEFALTILEAGLWGNTVFGAATRKLIDQAQKTDSLKVLSALIDQALKADLPEAIDVLLQKLNDQAALSQDVIMLMDALLPLVNALRYGSSRSYDIAALGQLIHHLIPRIFVGLPTTCVGINEESAKAIYHKITQTNRAVHLLDEQPFITDWYQTLEKIATLPRANALLIGAAIRLLFDKEKMSTDTVAVQMRYALSSTIEALQGAQWIEGFLSGSGMILIHHNQLWDIINEWIGELKEEKFVDLLPLLRRTFSDFTGPEREKILLLAKQEPGQSKVENEEVHDWDQQRAALVLPQLRRML
jgi:hypothetical protein